MTAVEYFDLVDKSGRMTRSDKRGAVDADLAPILLRIGANPEAWLDTVSRFGSKFRLAAGLLCHLRSFADQLGRRWLKGVAAPVPPSHHPHRNGLSPATIRRSSADLVPSSDSVDRFRHHLVLSMLVTALLP